MLLHKPSNVETAGGSKMKIKMVEMKGNKKARDLTMDDIDRLEFHANEMYDIVWTVRRALKSLSLEIEDGGSSDWRRR